MAGRVSRITLGNMETFGYDTREFTPTLAPGGVWRFRFRLALCHNVDRLPWLLGLTILP